MADNIIERPSQILEAEDAKKISPDGINKSFVGRLLFFEYDPKLKQQLPYYDRFPLIFPITITTKYIIGLNMHYLPLTSRAILIANFNKHLFNKKTNKLDINYDNLINSPTKFKLAKPTIHKYLYPHIVTNLIIIPQDKWNLILVAPLDRFKKEDNTTVWADSLASIKPKRNK